MKIKKLILVLSILFTTLNISGFTYPETLPNWENLSAYKLTKIIPGKTTLLDFQKNYPDAKKEILGNYTVFTATPTDKKTFNQIKLGFNKNKLEWIDFAFTTPVNLKNITAKYGQPKSINSTYSKLADYYNYSFFNISTNKQHTLAKSVSIFEIPLKINNKTLNNKSKIPKDILNIPRNLNLQPGYTLESTFISQYPELKPFKRNKFDTASVYKLNWQLGNAKKYYKEATLRFENGLLVWISLTPNYFKITDVLAAYNEDYSIEKINTKYILYQFKDKTVVADRLKGIVLYIGFFS